ncbi:MAG: hypothetical protein MUP16_11070 [Sedimentisphaerales bacterium]|nr:hypothetical protein [Sedimentisphaerales bacterium]
MKQIRLIVWVVVAIAACIIVWKVGFSPQPSEQSNKPVKTELVSQPSQSSKIQRPSDANQTVAASTAADVNTPRAGVDVNAPAGFADAGGRRGFGRRPGQGEMGGDSFGQFGRFGGFEGRSGRITDVNDANQPLEALNLSNVEMRTVIQKIAQWTGKTVIPDEEAERVRLSIYAPDRMSKDKALALIYGALRMKGFVAEHLDDAIYIRAAQKAKTGFVPTIPADQPLAMLDNKDQIVQKFFKLESYPPSQMSQVIQPLISEYGYVSADETTSTLLVIDSVMNLMRIERIITEFDVPEAGQSEQKIFVVQHGDPSEIVQMLNILLGQTQGYSTTRSNTGRGGFFGQGGRGGGGMSQQTGQTTSQSRTQSSSGTQSGRTDSSRTTTATSVVIGATSGPIILIPEPRRKWIIARASAENIKQIEEWIKRLDGEEPVESEYEVVQLKYADASEVESSIGEGFRNLPGTEFLPSVLVEPLPVSRQVIVFGKKELREIVKKIIAEIDIPPGEFITEHFKLKYADPDQIKTNIDELYQEGLYSSSSSSTSSFAAFRGTSQGRRTSSTPSFAYTVKVLSYLSLKQVTVIASPEIMEKIREQIAEWDRPIDVNEVKPRIIELRNSDPIQMSDLLNNLFSQSSTSTSGTSATSMLLRGTSTTQAQQMQSVIGPLYGKLTFADVPGTKKIIVISKIPEAYDVIEQLVRDLDREEMAQIPKVIMLKYADPEELSERLNALFNDIGTTASIRRTPVGLSTYSMETGTSSTSSNTTNTSGSSTTTDYRPWWNTGRTTTNQEPISNVIGRIRFIPDSHSKALLVLAPPEFMDNIEKLVKELDVPGKQVMIRAIVLEVDHSKVTSLGVELATNPLAFGTLGENSIEALSSLTNVGRGGTTTDTELTRATSTMSTSASTGSGTVLGVGTDIYGLIDFLIKKTHAKVLNQQTVWTKDNEEASFFKGDKVAFQTSATTSVTAGNVQNYEYQRVGMTLRSRPSITPESNVDMVVNVILSQITGTGILGQLDRSEMETTTNMIIKNGQTIMLGGILSQKDQTIRRKLPLLGDIPLVGGLFGHEAVTSSNSELIVFITPFVIDELTNMLPEAEQEMNKNKAKLENIQKDLNSTLEPIIKEENTD